MVLGAGGAARAVIQALKERGFTDIRVANRTVSRADRTGRPFRHGRVGAPARRRRELLGDAGLLVNTTALGMAGKAGADELPADPDKLPRHAIVTDIVYVPLETPLLAAARRAG